MSSQTQTVTLTYLSTVTKEDYMKTIEEMIATHTKEEWQKIIRSEMNELGLCFSEDTEYQGGDALW